MADLVILRDMTVSKDELIAILSRFNPWWRKRAIPDLPSWRRAVFAQLWDWVTNPPTHRAVLLSGARQVGKTTLVWQIIQALIHDKVPPGNILYVTLDHPALKLAGIDTILEAWREREPRSEGIEYIFLDEAQFIPDWGTWIKHQVDFDKKRRIVFTGSAMPILVEQESGVGRWHTIRISTLSFYEYLEIKKISLPVLPETLPTENFHAISETLTSYVGHFNEYLVRGGYPQTVQIESITQAQQLIRDDIIDKILKRDMTALFGVRRIFELEQTFLYFCLHDGGILDMQDLCKNLGVKRPTAQNFIDLLEKAHLIYRLLPFGYGKEVLRARFKIFLSDPALASAVLLRGKSVLEDPKLLGEIGETAVFKHLYGNCYAPGARFTYWRGDKEREVDIVMERGEELIPFEVKYRSSSPDPRELKELINLCTERSIKRAYVITKSPHDIGPCKGNFPCQIVQIPAALFCYWLGKSELLQRNRFSVL